MSQHVDLNIDPFQAALEIGEESADVIALGELSSSDSRLGNPGDIFAFRPFSILKRSSELPPVLAVGHAKEAFGAERLHLEDGAIYLLFLRLVSEPEIYEIVGGPLLNQAIDHRRRAPSGESLAQLKERFSAALERYWEDIESDTPVELVRPATIPLPQAQDNDPPGKSDKGKVELQRDGTLAVQTMLYEGFEGVFPGSWSVFDNNGTANGEVYWDDTSYRSYAGSWSAGCADGGFDSSLPGTDYSNNMDSWMLYGPFNLSDATDGSFSFRLWNDSEVSFDWLNYMVSINGTNFYGYRNSGNTGGWVSRTIDLQSVPTLGDITGDSSVWIAFIFTSDSSVTYEGAYVDEVVVQKTTAGAADLDLKLIDAPSGTFSPGASITVNNMTENIGGTTSAPYRITFYASTNTTISTADTSLGFVDRAAIAPGGVHNFNTTMTLPASLADGNYYIGAILTVSDANSANNVNYDSVPITVAGAAPADLDLQLVDAPSGTFAPGNSITVRNTTRNIGAQASSTYRITFYASTNTIISGADTSLGFVDRAALGAGGVHDFNTTMTLPASLADGNYYIGAILTVSDASASNNINYDPTPITVSSNSGGTPDIRISPTLLSFSGSKSVGGSVPFGGKSASSFRELTRKAESQGSVRVIIGLDVATTPEGRLTTKSAQHQRQQIRQKQDAVLAQMLGTGAILSAQFETIPFLAFEVDAEALTELARLDAVISIEEDVAVPPTMSSSNPVIGSPNAWAAGFDGTGQTVAVLDTGVDKSHPFFTTGGNKVVSEACYSTTSSANSSTSFCPGGASSSTAAGSGLNCSTSISGCDHGTHVAGSVAGNNGSGPHYGVGRGANLIAIQVFSRFDNSSICGSSAPCILTYTSDQIRGLERVYALRNTYAIAAVNMSLGGGEYSSESACDAGNASRKAAIDNLRSAGIATVIAAGNDGFTTSMSAPGCISTAVSVGATTDSDSVASFSNIASFIDLLAPGVSITSSVPGGGTGTKQGTSMATPHVAGAWAVLKQKAPSASVDAVLNALREAATRVDDNRLFGSVTDMRRINVDQALNQLGGGGGISKTFTIYNDGNATLSVTAMSLQTAASWIQISPSAPFSIAAGGSRQITVTVDAASAPLGRSTNQIDISSNDSDENPYPGGVDLVIDISGNSSEIFRDSFETGSTSRWSQTVP